MTGILQESLRNSLVVVCSFIFGALFVIGILYLVYKFVLVNIDWNGLMMGAIKKLFEPK